MLEWQPILRNGWTLETRLTERQRRTLAGHPEYAEIVRRLQAGTHFAASVRTNKNPGSGPGWFRRSYVKGRELAPIGTHHQPWRGLYVVGRACQTP